MVDVPFLFRPLLHHIVPGEYLVFLIVLQEVERGAGKIEYVGVLL